MDKPAPRTHHRVSSPFSSHVARSAALVAFFFAADKLLGLVRDVSIGYVFGASAALDAYYAAFELLDALLNVVAGLAMATALIPMLSARVIKGERGEAWRPASAVSNWVLLIVATHQHFLLPAAAPLVYTPSCIGGALLLGPRWGVFGLGWGGLAGTVGHFLI